MSDEAVMTVDGKEVPAGVANTVKSAIASGATVTVDGKPIAAAIPPHIAANICEMLKRVKVEGMEALAWVEAFSFMQRHAPVAPTGPGVPFTGQPPK